MSSPCPRPPARSAGEREQTIQYRLRVPPALAPDNVRFLLRPVAHPVLIVVDEADRVRDSRVKAMLADTIKSLSDHSANVTLVIVGVADDVDGLIAEHQSIERCLVQVRMPRMSSPEVGEIVDKGMEVCDLTADSAARARIVLLSEGLPHYTHLLAQEAAFAAVERGQTRIRAAEVEQAIQRALDKVQQSILSLYHRATVSPRKDNLYRQVLTACALAPTDELGYFAAAEVRLPMIPVMRRPLDIPAFSRHLNEFSEGRGPALQKTGTQRRFRFRHYDPLLQPFAVLHAISSGLITDDMVRDARGG